MSTSLSAQARAGWTAGLSATVGGGWQYEGVDVGVIRPGSFGPMRRYAIIARIGSFVDEGAILGAARGFVGGLALALQSKAVTIAEVGHELDLSQLGADVTVEVAGYGAAKSPFPEGSAWFSVAVLPGVRFGSDRGMTFAISAGPALFVGKESSLRAFLGIHAEFPVAMR